MKDEPSHQVIAPGALDSQIGKSVPVTNSGGVVIGTAVVVDTDDQGLVVEMTLTDHGEQMRARAVVHGEMPPMSFAFRDGATGSNGART